jgi:pimeloyl-ACP methyl ester carboxylesterase
MSRRKLTALLRPALCGLAMLVWAGAHAQEPDTIPLGRGVALAMPKGYAEVVVVPNPVEYALARGSWKAPRTGEKVLFPGGGESLWKAVAADRMGWFADSVLGGCYVYVPVVAKKRTIMILRAMGDEMAYVNGAPRAGNPYCLKDERESWEPDFDYSRLPVSLEPGRNDFLFRCTRGRFKARLEAPPRPIMLNARDVTLPDLVAGEMADSAAAWGAIVLVNATREPLRDLTIQASIPRNRSIPVRVPIIAPLSVRKVGFVIGAREPATTGTVDLIIRLRRWKNNAWEELDAVTVPLRVVDRYENRKETFVSAIDGSVQYYAINPARGGAGGVPPALFLTLHGASVEALNQSASYEPKTWGHVVAPTNRRPYGFNWEEWGRLDALEVLDLVTERYRVDESRVYLTGHSMGGHGVWHIGSLYPDRFAALGVSAGWISFWTYRFPGLDLADTSSVRRMIRRSTTPSETFRHVENYAQLGVYVLHGADDDNVPVAEARSMVERLARIHADFVYHEEPRVGHWWDLSDEPGVDCVDWAPMFDFFGRHARPGRERIREIRFLTSNPGVSARNNWLVIDAQTRQLEMSSADVRVDPGLNRFVGTTDNVARLALDLDLLRAAGPIAVDLDGTKLEGIQRWPQQTRLWLERTNGAWAVASEPGPELKGSRRYGTFKEAFRNRVIFVYGTKGSGVENVWAFNKARYDAEKLWYQGNGSIDVVADVDFDPSKEPDRSVILYGNETTNAAWKTLLAGSPVRVSRDGVKVGGRAVRGDDLCCIFVRPRSRSATASVGVVSGSGIVGLRLANRLPYLNPGINLPDCTIFNSEVLANGDPGVLVTGFFGLDWSVEKGEMVWNAR